MNVLSAKDLGEALGVDQQVVAAEMPKADFRYKAIALDKLEACLLEILETLESHELSMAGPRRAALWYLAWQRNLERYLATRAIQSLVPDYLRRSTVLRYRQSFIQTMSQSFEADYYTTVCKVLFRRYFSEVATVIEFGCGPGYALALLSQMFPDKLLIGCDWVRSSQSILQAIADTGLCIQGLYFDMFSPHATYDTVPVQGAGVFTTLAMEQLGDGWRPFLGYLLAKRPKICVHLEPLLELYEEDRLLDFLAVRYHKHRGYLTGFLPELRRLMGAGKLKIVDVRRLYFGSFFHEPYSVVVWRPL